MKYFCCSNFLLCVFFPGSDSVTEFFSSFCSRLLIFSKLVTLDSSPLWKLCLYFCFLLACCFYFVWHSCTDCPVAPLSPDPRVDTYNCIMASPKNLLVDIIFVHYGIIASPQGDLVEFTLKRSHLKSST